MELEIKSLISKLSDPEFMETDVINWAAPIPSFGSVYRAQIATVGLNPSNKEFVDNEGNELKGTSRRFHTLNSLGLSNWNEIQSNHIELILEYCERYFMLNSYETWFRRLDFILLDCHASYYFPFSNVCHLDLIPFATSLKWNDLSAMQRKILLDNSANTLGRLLNMSDISVLILNGKAVVNNFQKLAGIQFEVHHMPEWTLPRKFGDGVNGYSYKGAIGSIGTIVLNRQVKVLGYNHNLQSSYGVSLQVQTAIRDWITLNLN